MTRRLVVASALLVAVYGARLAAQPVTVPEFTNRLAALAASIRAADAPTAVRLASSVPPIEHVMAGGHAFDVALDWVKTELGRASSDAATWPERRERLVERLNTVAAEARMLGDTASPGDGSARRVLTDVLADRRFERARRPSWQQALQERIREWLTNLFARTSAYGWGRRRIVTVVAWTLSSAALAVLIVWLARLGLRRRAERPIGVGVAAILPPGHVLGAEAAALIRGGRVRDGARAAYRAVLRRLEEEGVLRLDASRTPRETLRLVAPAHRRAAPLAAMTGAFERIWYASRPIGHEDGPRLLALLREFECLPPDRAT